MEGYIAHELSDQHTKAVASGYLTTSPTNIAPCMHNYYKQNSFFAYIACTISICLSCYSSTLCGVLRHDRKLIILGSSLRFAAANTHVACGRSRLSLMRASALPGHLGSMHLRQLELPHYVLARG